MSNFQIGNNELHLLFGLILSVITGFIIGLERESRDKDAGVSTHILVIVGSLLFTHISFVIDSSSQTRIAAQIVSGIGFLGAGLIIKDGANVRNLTTAASIWVVGSIGMAFGFHLYFAGFIAALSVALVPRIPKTRHIVGKKKKH